MFNSQYLENDNIWRKTD